MKHKGFKDAYPQLEKVAFQKAGMITLYLTDGRIISAPLNRFPAIERLDKQQRRQYHIADGTVLMFQDSNEIYHIQDFLGTYQTNAYTSPMRQTGLMAD